MMKVFLTGGLGYIGSHTAVALSKAGYDLVIFDDLSNSKVSVLKAIEELGGKKVEFIDGNVLDTGKLTKCLIDYGVGSVIHFAGLKAVGESIESPIRYYDSNVGGAISLLSAMKTANISHLIFSSSATVYGAPRFIPITEEHPLKALNPYGRTKLIIEEMLNDLAVSDPDWRISCLRYFNPVGAHASASLGEDPSNIPNNLMPRIVRVAASLEKQLFIFGSDYSTDDGTCERDYIHVEDLAEGHLAALEHMKRQKTSIEFFNLGTGHSYSVLKLVAIFKEVTGKEVPTVMADRRPGDSARCFADVTKSKEILGWNAKKTVAEMCSSAWQFHQANVTRLARLSLAPKSNI